ncbi:MAG: DUF934 domain-containing protein [Halieaceae bacterium]|nr:DUF934 domain-containing protein [Halieaceae bacterium]
MQHPTSTETHTDPYQFSVFTPSTTEPHAAAPGLRDWIDADIKPSRVTIAPGEDFAVLFDQLHKLQAIEIQFPVFTDGRGFSTARELRERGYTGTLQATGAFITDQIEYLSRCGFNAFEFQSASHAKVAQVRLAQAREVYQGDARQPLPLFRRRISQTRETL